MSDSRQRTGRLGETAAMRYLTDAGWRIIDRNVRCREGEIDIIAHDGAALVFVEVRTRTSARYGLPEESVTPSKARSMGRCALAYLAAHHELGGDWRVDFVAVNVVGERVTELRHYKHALDW